MLFIFVVSGLGEYFNKKQKTRYIIFEKYVQ